MKKGSICILLHQIGKRLQKILIIIIIKHHLPESLETALTLNNFKCKTFQVYAVTKMVLYGLEFEKHFTSTFSGNNFLNYNQKKISGWIPEFLKGHSRSIIAITQK